MAADVAVSGGRASDTPSLSLDASGCVSLQDILLAFNAPISEEHAWALCFECVKCFQNALHEHGKCLLVSEPEHIFLHKDGQVHVRTVLPEIRNNSSSDKNDSTAGRPFTSSQQKLTFHLGLALFKALEFGFQEEEERRLGADLERLIDLMTTEPVSGEDASEKPETDDEGIEQDSGDGTDDVTKVSPFSFDSGSLHTVITKVIEHCNVRQASQQRGQSEAHYRAVCRALVAEALELASFLERVSQGTQSLPCVQVDPETCHDLDQLKFTDWSGRRIWRALQARLWMQVIQELRNGVQLKKVQAGGPCLRNPTIEYELTPYEILMDDIRAKRYKLNKVMVDGEIPQRVKKDAHAIILEFIRSRPPLRKASERKLGPAPDRAPSPRELLMESIKQEHRLRPSASPIKRLSLVRADTAPQTLLKEPSREPEGTPMRRLIQVDFSKFQDEIEDDDDDLICSLDSPASPAAPPVPAPRSNVNPWRRTDSTGSTSSTGGNHLKLRYDLGDLLAGSRASGFISSAEHPEDDGAQGVKEEAPEPAPRTERPASLLLDSYDLATQCPSRRATLRRRHTVAGTKDDKNENEVNDELPAKRCSHAFDAEKGEEAEEDDDTRTHTSLGSCELNWSRSSLQDELLHSSHWQSAMECLSLTLEEIVHIRSVLTKAELDGLPVEGRIKEEVEKRKVCFLCMKTRFSIFGPWGQKCKLCQRTVCNKCCDKMRIPTEHFSRVPVFALSPGLSSPEGSDDGSSSPTFGRSLMNRLLAAAPQQMTAPPAPAPQRFNSVGSAPTSPTLTRRTTSSATPTQLHSDTPPPLKVELETLSSSAGSDEKCPTENQPQSLPVTVDKPNPAQRGFLMRSKTLGRPSGADKTAEKLKGLQMIVCLDCKTMVLQIIKTSRTSRSQAIKNLSLNISPVY
ncbi:protein spire isoform X2 [Neocloeon triangulifer]|uniref:protein spire isoform X2 n=1 Tax=Neocloeon triangulifer TaxID=2078957 RepID=UPI00286EFD42|nr:protein spire isoform X2 [Neocloeon triangulifer]